MKREDKISNTLKCKFLKSKGYSYYKIGKILNLAPSEVRYLCSNHKKVIHKEIININDYKKQKDWEGLKYYISDFIKDALTKNKILLENKIFEYFTLNSDDILNDIVSDIDDYVEKRLSEKYRNYE